MLEETIWPPTTLFESIWTYSITFNESNWKHLCASAYKMAHLQDNTLVVVRREGTVFDFDFLNINDKTQIKNLKINFEFSKFFFIGCDYFAIIHSKKPIISIIPINSKVIIFLIRKINLNHYSYQRLLKMLFLHLMAFF